jgi:hypothetical protein
MFSGYQPCQVVKRRKQQGLKDHLCLCSQGADVSGEPVRVVYGWFSRHISTLRTRTEMVLETLVFSPFNQLTRLVAREHFIICSHKRIALLLYPDAL